MEAKRFAQDYVESKDQLKSISHKEKIEVLAKSIKKMENVFRVYIDDLTRVTTQKERIGAERSAGAQNQTGLLPRIILAFPERFLVDEGHLGLVMADVSEKRRGSLGSIPLNGILETASKCTRMGRGRPRM